MAASKRLKQLKSRVSEIEVNFMPAVRGSGNYSRCECDQMRAYRILVHAEIESFIEERATAVLTDAYERYKNSRKLSSSLISVLTYTEISSQGAPSKSTKTHDSCFTRLSRAVSHFRNWVQHHNHGIKEENILKILLPIGLEVPDIDATLLNTLNSFGSARGSVAHSSGKAKQIIDPVTEKATVGLLIQELEKLDYQLSTLR